MFYSFNITQMSAPRSKLTHHHSQSHSHTQDRCLKPQRPVSREDTASAVADQCFQKTLLSGFQTLVQVDHGKNIINIVRGYQADCVEGKVFGWKLLLALLTVTVVGFALFGFIFSLQQLG